jgi:hypothetical protein
MEDRDRGPLRKEGFGIQESGFGKKQLEDKEKGSGQELDPFFFPEA